MDRCAGRLVAAAVVSLPGMSIYRITQNGAMLGGVFEGVKIWKDEVLN